jgi:regulator of PEP synthase PpsR (kinase-PPPase family)
MTTRQVFFVSDRTGITAEMLGEALLTQFPDIEFARSRLLFIDTLDKAHAAARQISEACADPSRPPVVFSTLIDPAVQAIITASTGKVFDLFGTFLEPLERTLDAHSSHKVGRMHGMGDIKGYEQRIRAVNFTLDHDDGQRVRDLPKAQIVLTGVSRCGKTPTCLYLALQFDLRAANYPLTEEDLEQTRLPETLRGCRELLHGLTIKPERLSRIREERRPGSRYASLQQCRTEIARAESLFRAEGVPFIDVTSISIEEIATLLVEARGLPHRHV